MVRSDFSFHHAANGIDQPLVVTRSLDPMPAPQSEFAADVPIKPSIRA